MLKSLKSRFSTGPRLDHKIGTLLYIWRMLISVKFVRKKFMTLKCLAKNGTEMSLILRRLLTLATGGDFDWPITFSTLRANLLDCLHDVHSLDHRTEDNVFAIKPFGLAVGLHKKHKIRVKMLHFPLLIREKD